MGHKLLHLGAEDAHALHVALFAALTHELCAYTDAQHGLGERGDEGVETALGELGHGRRGLAHTGENDLVGFHQYILIIGIHPVGATHTLERIGHRANVACVVIYYRYHNTPLLLGRS